MKWKLITKLLGLLSLLVSVSMAGSLPWAFPVFGVCKTFEARGFFAIIGAMSTSAAIGCLLFYMGRKAKGNMLQKEALAVVGLGWMLAGILGALPFIFAQCEREPGVTMTLVDSLFESISGFTTTGASVISELEEPLSLPRCVLFWRSETHWLGGIGIVVIFVALLRQQGASGKSLMRNETTGPINESVRPRVQEAASYVLYIYIILTVLLVALFWLEGMTLYDALCHSFGTMATGGFSTHNHSLGYFQSPVIEFTTILFMLISGTSFSLYYLLWRGQKARDGNTLKARLRVLLGDPEWRAYIGIVIVVTLAVMITLLIHHKYDFLNSFRHSLFVTVSLITTTGFGTEDFSQWGEFCKGLFLLLMFVGGCAGSTAGGVKVVRCILFVRIIMQEIEKAYRPKVIRPLRLGGEVVDESIRHNVVMYWSIIFFLFVLGFLALAIIEPDSQWTQYKGHAPNEKLLDCASAVITALNNVGPGLGVLGPASNFAGFSSGGKLLLTLLMLLGRLELFAILVLFMPSFWKKH